MATRQSIYMKEYQRERIDAFNAKWRDHLACLTCGGGPVVFHHVDPATKSFNVEYGRAQGKPDAEIQAEIDKCEPLCIPCHQRLHKEQGKGSISNRKVYDREAKRLRRTDPVERAKYNAYMRAYNASRKEIKQ